MTPTDAILIDACNIFKGEDAVLVDAIKLQAFLQATSSLALPPAERLRQLTIHLQHEKFAEGWQGMRKIFLAAIQEEEPDWKLYHSWGIIVLDYSQKWTEPDLSRRLKFATEGISVLHQALELSPANSDIAHVLGYLYYNHPLRSEKKRHYRNSAREWFSRAVEWNPQNDIAQLYKAYCYHDAGDWQRAIEAYSGVNQQRLQEEWPKWRAVKLREQLAYCYAKAGDIEEANRRFTIFLDYVEKLNEEAFEDEVITLNELVMALRETPLLPSLLSRVRKLIARTRFMTWYESL